MTRKAVAAALLCKLQGRTHVKRDIVNTWGENVRHLPERDDWRGACLIPPDGWSTRYDGLIHCAGKCTECGQVVCVICGELRAQP